MTDNNGTRPLTLSVVGTGYLGATHAACMAELGFNVIATDVDPRKVAMLSTGVAPFFEPGLNELLQAHVRSGRLRFTSDITEIAAECDVHFICVGTPQGADGVANTSYLEAAFAALVTHIRRDALIVGKSTVPVGTAERLRRLLPNADVVGIDVDLAWNPEFLREGFAVSDSLAPDRLVFGVHSATAERMLRRVYDKIIRTGVPVITTDLASSQIIKMAANAFLASKISFINAMAEVCEAAAADVLDVATALGLDQRIGAAFLRPGLGFGGGCLPKDIRAFQHRAAELGVGDAVSFLDQVDEINKRCRDHVVNAA